MGDGRGGFGTRPYQIIHNQDNPVHVVGHDHKRIQFKVRVMVGQIVPCPDNDLPKWIHPHLALHHLAKQTFATLRANGDKIRPRLTIIVTFQPNTAAIMTLGMRPHRCRSAFKGITLTTSFPRKLITSTAMDLCSLCLNGKDTSPRIRSRSSGALRSLNVCLSSLKHQGRRRRRHSKSQMSARTRSFLSRRSCLT